MPVIIEFSRCIGTYSSAKFESFIYGAEHVEHQCTGNDCPICATINQSMNSLKQLGLGVVFIAATAITIFVATLQRKDYNCFCSVSTLFSQKVRLNN